MRVIVNGPSGIDKKEYLTKVVRMAEKSGKKVKLFNIGDMMYAKRPKIRRGRILELPLPELNEIRRTVLQKTLREATKNTIVNTHACFRWRHALLPAFDLEYINELSPDAYITIIDDVDAMKARLDKDTYWRGRYTLKDLMTWRDEEVFITELIADFQSKPHYVVAREHLPDTLFKLIFKPDMKKAYVSHPITHVLDQPKTKRKIDLFKTSLKDIVILFDPFTIKERGLVYKMTEASKDHKKTFTKKVLGRQMRFSVDEINAIKEHIDGQIIARDFKMIDQSDMLIAYIPLYEGTRKPVASGGVDTEINYAHGSTKDVFYVCRERPSPFIERSITRRFESLDELLEFLRKSCPQ